jgi:membrane protease YdiL (CAAX protease family)
MYLKGIYADKSALFQLYILLLLVLGGLILASFITTIPLLLLQGIDGSQKGIAFDPSLMRISQFISAVGTFLLPACFFAWLCSNQPKRYLSIGKLPTLEVLALTFLSMFLINPAISLTGLLNQQMELPSFMEGIEHWMRTQEDEAERLTLLLLSEKGIGALLANLLVVALTAGITEEFLFRGAFQRILERWTSNPHWVIWIAACLFSAFHMQFYGFLPRMLLGAYFGYLLYWSRNIWIPVFAHFTNNAFAVICMSDEQLKQNEFISGEVTTPNLLPYIVMAVIGLVLFYFCGKRLKELTNS